MSQPWASSSGMIGVVSSNARTTIASGLALQRRGDLGRERRLAGRELVAVALGAVDDLTAVGLDRLLGVVAQTGAVGVVEHDEGDPLVAVGA